MRWLMQLSSAAGLETTIRRWYSRLYFDYESPWQDACAAVDRMAAEIIDLRHMLYAADAPTGKPDVSVVEHAAAVMNH